MKTAIFALVNESTGPEPHLALLTDGEWFNLGNPHPLFTSRNSAEHYRDSNSLIATVHELELRD